MSRSGVVEWTPDAVIEAIGAEVEGNMEIAAKVVQGDARRNLLRVSKPEFGLKYRRLLALYRLTSKITRSGSTIEARIGIPRGEKGGDYGFWIETGSKAAAAHPWLRPALVNNLRNIVQLLGGR